MSTNRALATTFGTQDLGRPVATRTGKVIHRLAKVNVVDGEGQMDCGKVLPLITAKHVTLVAKKGRWGVLLGGGSACIPTCAECLAAHTAEIESRRKVSPREVQEDTALKFISAVPATEAGHAELRKNFGAKDGNTAEVGDLAYLYSRGSYRLGVVTKVTPTKVRVLYTTDGAVKEAVRIYDAYATIDPQEHAKSAADTAAKNWTYYRKNVADCQARIERGGTLPDWEYRSFQADLDRITRQTRDEYIASQALGAFEAAEAKRDANKTYRQYVHFTGKDAKKDDIYLV
jgi:hypothetical protein